MKKTFIFKLKLKGTKKIFREGWVPGVIVRQELTLDLPKGYNKTLVAAGLLDEEDRFIKECIEVLIEEK